MGFTRLRVLHAIHDFLPRHPAGSEIYAADLCAAIAMRGHYPVVLCAEFDPARTHGELTWRSYEGLPVIEIANNWSFSSFEETYRSPVLSRVMKHVLEIVQPDVLHVHNLLNLSLDLPQLAKARGIPVVATLHDYTLVCPSGGQRIHRAERHVCHTIEPMRCARCFPDSPFHTQLVVGRMTNGRSGRLVGRAATAVRRTVRPIAAATVSALKYVRGPSIDAAAIERRLTAAREASAFCDLFVAPSRALAEEYARLGFPAEKIMVSGYGFRDGAPDSTRAPVSQPADQPPCLRIGFVGMPIWHKGVDLLIDALRLIETDRVNVSIHGDANVEPDYMRDLTSRAAGLPVHFKGSFGRHELQAVYASLDLVVVPSRWLENSPLVIHEAFRAGVPVAAARIGGIPELIQHGRNGLLFEPDSVDAVAAAINTVLDDPECLSRFRAAVPAVKRIEDDALEWEGRYEAVLGRDRTAEVSVL